MSRRPKPHTHAGRNASVARAPSPSRYVAMLIATAVAAALLVSLGWLFLVSTATGLVVVPDGLAYPADWSSLGATAQSNWLHAHAVNLTGLAAATHMVQHFGLFWQQFAAVAALTLSSAFVALVIFSVLRGRGG